MKSDNKNIVNRLESFDYTTHHRMPKIKLSKKRRRIAYRGIINQEPIKFPEILLRFDIDDMPCPDDSPFEEEEFNNSN